MAITVHEIMNPEIYFLRPSQGAARAVRELQALGITSAPVVDGDRLVGLASLEDLVGANDSDAVQTRMRSPIALAASTPIATAAELMAEADIHHMAILDRNQCLVGFLSTLDILRGVLGLPARHPTVFARTDPRSGMAWSHDSDFTLDHVEAAPETAGVLALVVGGTGRPEQVVWAEQSGNLRQRLLDLLTARAPADLDLASWRSRGRLRFRTAVGSPDRAAVVVDALQRLAGYARP